MAKLVLTWGQKPKDLDIYVLAPHADPTKPPCEVNWREKQCFSRSVVLDRDDTQGGGPETISLQNMNRGQYIVRVDEYRGSPAASQMINPGKATVAYYAPHVGGMFNYAGSDGYIEGRVWYVLLIDGVTREVKRCTRELCPPRPQPRD
jgi:hypothetical protein